MPRIRNVLTAVAVALPCVASCDESNPKVLQSPIIQRDEGLAAAKQITLTRALEILFSEISASYGKDKSSREMRITATRQADGWLIWIVLLPETPGAEYIAMVDDSGAMELSPLW